MQLGRRSRYIYVYAVCTWCVVGSIQPIGHFVIGDCFCPFFFLEIPFWLRTYSESPQGQSPPSCSGHTDVRSFCVCVCVCYSLAQCSVRTYSLPFLCFLFPTVE